MSRFDDELARRRTAGLLREPVVTTPLGGGRCKVDGRTLWDFSSNDYLGLARDPRLSAAASNAAREFGAGAGASALVTGRGPIHDQLERALAEFEDEPSALLFPTGFAANLGTVSAIASQGDAVFCDRSNHASLIDGAKLSGATLRVYRRERLDALKRDLIKCADRSLRLIVTDSVFSMDGDAAPLPELLSLAEAHDALLLVDEAHGTGVCGPTGRGLCEHFGLRSERLIKVGTLSKAVGSLGGFVSGSESLIEYLRNSARTQIYSTALPHGVCAASIAGLQVIDAEPDRRVTLLAHAEHFAGRLSEAGLPIPTDLVGPIVPVPLTDPERAVRWSAQLADTGFRAVAIRPPTVPRNTSRLRVSLSSAHPRHAVDALADEIVRLWDTEPSA